MKLSEAVADPEAFSRKVSELDTIMTKAEYIELGYRRALWDLQDALRAQIAQGQRTPRFVDKAIEDLMRNATERAKQ